MIVSKETLDKLTAFQGLVTDAVKTFNSGDGNEVPVQSSKMPVEQNTSAPLDETNVVQGIDNCDGNSPNDTDNRLLYFDKSVIEHAYTQDNQDAVVKAMPFFPSHVDMTYNDFVSHGVNPILLYMGRSRRNHYIPSAEQLRVLYSCAPRLLIDSGPGTGKTTTIVRKAFIEQNIFGLSSDDILAFTYTEAGVISMNSRYSLLTQEFSGNRSMEFRTIHSWCKKFMSVYSGNYEVLSETNDAVESYWDEEAEEYIDTKISMYTIITDCMETAGVNTKVVGVNEFYSALSIIIERNITNEDEMRAVENLVDFPVDLQQILAVKKLYKNHKNSLGVIDYNDMLEDTRDILKTIRDGKYIYQNELQKVFYKYKCIYVDEFQDITPLQLEVISLLVDINRDLNVKLTCIGDMDQGIYSFKGADIRVFTKFVEMYKDDGMDVIFLTQNRRSEQLIIDLANWVIERNEMRFPKKIQGVPGSVRGGGSITAYADATGGIAQGLIKKRILDEWAKPVSDMSQFAIMYRENKEISPYVNILIEHRIPFCTKLDSRRKMNYAPHMSETSDMLGLIDLLRAPANPDLVTKSLFKMVPYMAKEEAVRIAFELRENRNARLVGILKRESKYAKGIDAMVMLREALLNPDTKPSEFIRLLANHYRTTYYDFYLKKGRRSGRVDNLGYVIDYLSSKNTLEYLRDKVEEDKTWLLTNSNNTLGVNLTTFSSSKGLEYRNIFILPIQNVGRTHPRYEKLSDHAFNMIIEEARRLFYVTVTRAINNIVYFYEPIQGEDLDYASACKNCFTNDILSFLASRGVPFSSRMTLNLNDGAKAGE